MIQAASSGAVTWSSARWMRAANSRSWTVRVRPCRTSAKTATAPRARPRTARRWLSVRAGIGSLLSLTRRRLGRLRREPAFDPARAREAGDGHDHDAEDEDALWHAEDVRERPRAETPGDVE